MPDRWPLIGLSWSVDRSIVTLLFLLWYFFPVSLNKTQNCWFFFSSLAPNWYYQMIAANPRQRSLVCDYGLRFLLSSLIQTSLSGTKVEKIRHLISALSFKKGNAAIQALTRSKECYQVGILMFSVVLDNETLDYLYNKHLDLKLGKPLSNATSSSSTEWDIVRKIFILLCKPFGIKVIGVFPKVEAVAQWMRAEDDPGLFCG